MPIPSRTPKTEQAYLMVAAELSERAQRYFNLPADEPCHPKMLLEFLKVIAPTLRPPTVRYYRASVRLMFFRYAEGADGQPYREALFALLDLELKGAAKSAVPARCSSLKRKSIQLEELDRLAIMIAKMKAFWPVRSLRWLQAAIVTGLRPSEWRDVQWLGDPAEGKLLVKNAKNTNGRSHGMTRIVEVDWNHWLAPAVKLHMKLLDEWMKHEGNTFEMYYTNSRKALQRVVRDLWPRRSQHVTLYTGRHQFSANLKADGADPQTVAYLMGHNSEETAQSHYGKRRSGWGRRKPTPSVSPVLSSHEPNV